MAISRPKRWTKACEQANDALGKLEEALQELADLQGEYQEWLDNLPENLQSGALAEKLQAVCDMDFEGAEGTRSEISDIISDAESTELPQGFGRD